MITSIPDRMYGKFFSITEGWKALKDGFVGIPKELFGFEYATFLSYAQLTEGN